MALFTTLRSPVSPARYARITRGALWSLGLIVVSGGAVRLTGSGLGCSDWPTCEKDQFVADLEYHALVEFVNRLFTGVVSAAVIMAVLASMRRIPRRRHLTWWSWGLVVGVIAQIVLGAILVKTELDPRFTLGHFLLSMVLVWNATVLDVRAREHDGSMRAPVSDRLRQLLRVVSVVGAGLLVTGTLVTGSGPHGGDEDVERLPFLVRDVTRIHSITAICVLAIVVFTWRTARSDGASLAERRLALVAALLVVQGTLGYTQYFTGVPVVLVGVHLALATLTWVAIVRAHLTAPPRRVVAAERDPQLVGS